MAALAGCRGDGWVGLAGPTSWIAWVRARTSQPASHLVCLLLPLRPPPASHQLRLPAPQANQQSVSSRTACTDDMLTATRSPRPPPALPTPHHHIHALPPPPPPFLFHPSRLQAHFRVSRSAQHLIQADDAAAYYGPCDPPPAPCPRPRGFNLEADYFNITPYHRFKEFYRYKGEPARCPPASPQPPLAGSWAQ